MKVQISEKGPVFSVEPSHDYQALHITYSNKWMYKCNEGAVILPGRGEKFRGYWVCTYK